MPKEQQPEATSLADFQFDEGTDFFGIGAAAKQGGVNTLLQQVSEEDDFLPDDNKVTNLEEAGKAGGATTTGVPANTGSKQKPESTKGGNGEAAPAGVVEEEDDEEDNDETFFGVENEEEEEEVTVQEASDKKKKKEGQQQQAAQPEGQPDGDDKKFFTALAKDLKTKGFLETVEIDETKEISDEELADLVGQDIDARIEEGISVFAENLDEDGKNFLRHKKAGGSTAAFLATYHNVGINLDTFKADNEAERGQLIRYYLTNVEKIDAEELEDRITFIKESGKEEQYATKWAANLKGAQKKAQDELIKVQEERQQKADEEAKEFTEELTKLITGSEALGVFPLTKQDKQTLAAYITKPTVKVGKGKYAPQFHYELGQILNAKTPENKEKLLILARLLSRKFDVSDIKVVAKTEVTKKAQSNLAKAKENVSSGKTVGQQKSLADYL